MLLSVLTEMAISYPESDGSVTRRQFGSVRRIGTWKPEAKDYESKLGDPVRTPLETSPRALQEGDTVTLIDTRREGESPRIQLSDFSWLENRETHEIEIFVSPLSYRHDPRDPARLYEAPVRRYALRFTH